MGPIGPTKDLSDRRRWTQKQGVHVRRVLQVLLIVALLGSACSDTPDGGTTSQARASTTAAAAASSSTVETIGLPPLPFGAALDAVLSTGVEEGGGFGVTAAVIAPGFAPWTGAAGDSIRGGDGDVAMKPGMLFEVGSIDKHFTAALALRLQELGLLDLDALLSEWVSGHPNLHPDITLRHLLSSTSGVANWVQHPDSLFRAPWDQVDWDRVWTIDAMLTELVGEPEFPPGEGWQYSTTGFRLARHVIEETTGRSWAAGVREYLLEPAGITDAWIAGEGPVPPGIEIAHEWYDTDGDGVLEDVTGRTDAQYSLKPGGLHLSALDLADWCNAVFRERSVLSEDSLSQMTAFRAAVDPDEPLVAEYGLGLGRFSLPVLADNGHYGHSGLSFGYITAMIYLEEADTCVTFMVNDRLTIEFTADNLLATVISGP
jgi:D-alanyl-D-alanine carboxypeptidase